MKILLASGNKGKIREFSQKLAPLHYTVIAQSEFNIPEAEETGLSFIENAIIKARNASKHSGMPALADDSGLEVDALNGEPGIYSARYSGDNATDQNNNALLLSKLAGIPLEQRQARFHCVLAMVRHETDPNPLICQASWEGHIIEQAKGLNGFGYDPIFYVESEQCCSAELSPERKNSISHRGQAVDKLLRSIDAFLRV